MIQLAQNDNTTNAETTITNHACVGTENWEFHIIFIKSAHICEDKHLEQLSYMMVWYNNANKAGKY